MNPERTKLRLTARGWGVAALTLVLAVLAFVFGFPELLGLAVAAVVLFVVSLLLVTGGRGVTVTFAAPPRVERLSSVTVRMRVEADNAHRRGLRLLSVGGSSIPVVWDAVGIHADVPIRSNRRGPLTLGPWTLERVDPWGLLRRTVGSVEGFTVLVVPRVRQVSLASLPSAIADYGGSAEMGTTTFATLREYVVGDELRHVHWRSSAKTGTLMMRQYVDITRPRITLVLAVDPRAYVNDDDFEVAVDFIASLAHVAGASGLDVDVVTTAGDRASHNGARATAALDMLALVERVHVPPDARLMRGSRATTIVVCGHGPTGWWDRIPAMSVLRP